MTGTTFDISVLAYDIKRLIEHLMSHEEIGKRIKEEIVYYKQLKDDLQSGDSSNPGYREAFALLLEAIITQSWYYSLKGDERKNLYNLVHSYGVKGLTRGEGRKKLLELINRIGPRRRREIVRKKIIQLLNEMQTMEFHDWVKDLYNKAKKGKTKILGVKGRDDYLRCVGYWDRVPIDRHEARFIIRTGIFHACSLSDKGDPLERDHLQEAVRAFCKKYLNGFKVLGINLGEAPGILDKFIWYYCKEPSKGEGSNEEGLGICGKTPKCSECLLRNTCLFSLTKRGITTKRL